MDDEIPKVEEVSDLVENKWKSLSQQVEDLANSMFSAKERVKSFQGEIDDIEKWLSDTKQKISSLEPVAVVPEEVKEQLSEQTVRLYFKTWK